MHQPHWPFIQMSLFVFISFTHEIMNHEIEIFLAANKTTPLLLTPISLSLFLKSNCKIEEKERRYFDQRFCTIRQWE
jgi:hypothetical protein